MPPLASHRLSPASFEVVGYGCMTCIGNSGPLPEPVVEAIAQVAPPPSLRAPQLA